MNNSIVILFKKKWQICSAYNEYVALRQQQQKSIEARKKTIDKMDCVGIKGVL